MATYPAQFLLAFSSILDGRNSFGLFSAPVRPVRIRLTDSLPLKAMAEPQIPKRAATIILCRPSTSSGFEVFLIRRPEGMAFLGGMHCFPGGTVTKDDYSAAMLRCCRGLTTEQARKIIGAHFTPQEAMGFWVAGIRELFEETGILLTVNKTGEQVALKAERNSQLIEQRSE